MQNRKCNYYEFASLKIAFRAPNLKSWKDLEKFRISSTTSDIFFDMHYADTHHLEKAKLLYEEHGYEVYEKDGQRIRIFRHDHTREIVLMDIEKETSFHEVSFLKKYISAWGSSMMLKTINLPRQLIHHGGIFLHASFIIQNDTAILFSGKKQIGKSTQAELWQKYKNALIANGDRAILKKMNGQWYACGSPYCGTSKICNNQISPLKCIIILSQGSENMAEKATVKEAFISLLKNCSYETWDKKQVETTLQLIEQICSEVHFVKLSCLPDKSAVETLEEYLCQNPK